MKFQGGSGTWRGGAQDLYDSPQFTHDKKHQFQNLVTFFHLKKFKESSNAYRLKC